MCMSCVMMQGTFIHEWIYNVFKVNYLTLGPILQCQHQKRPLKKKTKKHAPAQSHQMTTLNHHLLKEVDFTVCTKCCYWYCSKIIEGTSTGLIVSLVSQGKICCILCNFTFYATSVMLLLQRLWETVLQYSLTSCRWLLHVIW